MLEAAPELEIDLFIQVSWRSHTLSSAYPWKLASVCSGL
jgi:hypothetical protein